MRIFTVIAGMIYVLTGALCFVFISYSFSSLAFPAGLLLVIAGLCIAGAYTASGKRYRLPDTVLVEGLVDIMFGFAVLNNQVSDPMLSMFFGTFTCIAGATRLSQAIDVSRYRPADWARVMPLSIVTAILGVIMMMPRLSLAAPTMILVGASFIINGFSMLIYSMYMEKRTATQKEEEARARTMAKKAAAEAKREQRDRLRKLSKSERDAAVAAIKKEKKEAKQARKEARRLEAELARASRRPQPDDTKSVTKDEAEEIKRIADKLGFSDEAVIKAAVEKAEKTSEAEVPAEAAAQEPEEKAAEEPKDAASGAPGKWPAWQRPVDIPSLRSAVLIQDEEQEGDAPVLPDLAAINLDELEKGEIDMGFESPELREVELVSEGSEPVDRKSIIEGLEKPIEEPSDFSDYVPLKLEDLIDEELPKPRISDKDDKRFTQRMSFTWGADPYSKDDLEKAREDKKQ
ncbi:MAG: hypothetical protein II617_00325 [Firmicutes bacterium]|nr:hypothetical protein [Bacillota bacterium]